VFRVDHKLGYGGRKPRQEQRCEHIGSLKNANPAAGVNQHLAVGTIQQPHFFAAGVEVLSNFAASVHGAFARRQDFDGDIGRERRRNFVLVDLAQTFCAEKDRKIRAADCVVGDAAIDFAVRLPDWTPLKVAPNFVFCQSANRRMPQSSLGKGINSPSTSS